jgi:hypothetical protein
MVFDVSTWASRTATCASWTFTAEQGITVIHRKKDIPLRNLRADLHGHILDQTRSRRGDTDIFIHALDQPASSNRVGVG